MGVIFLKNRSETDEWKKLMGAKDDICQPDNLSQEREYLEQCKILYKKNPDGHGLRLYDIWEAGKEYEEEVYAVPLKSVYAGYAYWPQGTSFSNIIDSTFDPRVFNLSWIHLYEMVIRVAEKAPFYEANECYTDGEFYDPSVMTGGDVPFNNHPDCGGIIVGGHVIQGKKNCQVNVGGDG